MKRPHESPPVSAVCLNCQARLHGPHCAHCGQRQAGRRLASRDVLRDAAEQWLSFDSALVRTVVGLTRSPGKTVLDYVAGRRARYVHPFKYCLVVTAGYFLLNSSLGIDPVSLMTDPGTNDRAQAVVGSLKTFLGTWLKDVILFLALPLFAWLLGWVFRREAVSYADRLVFVLYVTAQTFLLSLVVAPLAMIDSGLYTGGKAVFGLVYFCFAAVGFFEVPPVSGTIRAVIAKLLYFASVFVVILSVVLVIAAWIFW